jgi:hypothetical protein
MSHPIRTEIMDDVDRLIYFVVVGLNEDLSPIFGSEYIDLHHLRLNSRHVDYFVINQLFTVVEMLDCTHCVELHE